MRCAKSIEAKDEGELERAIETHDAEHAEFRKFMRERALARRGRGL
jgi:anti-sigma factor RsiW